jgi:predicted solute-binding protein
LSKPLKRTHPQIKALAQWQQRTVLESPGFGDEAHPLFKPRMGWMKYLNTFPMRCAYADMLASNTGAYHGELIHHPTMLNQALACNVLDLSLVSTAAYFEHQQDWVVFPQLCIASHGPVNSVLWLRTNAFDAMHHPLCIPQASASSVALLRYLLIERKACPADQVEYPPGTPWATLLETYQNVLLIGDAALQVYAEWQHTIKAGLNASNPASPFHVMDLASEWYAITGQPFIFGVWCAPNTYDDLHHDSIESLLVRLSEGVRYHLTHEESLYARYMAERTASSSGEAIGEVFDESVLLPYWNENLSYTMKANAFYAALSTIKQAFYPHA